MPRTISVIARQNAAGQPVVELRLHSQARDGRQYTEILAFRSKEDLIAELSEAVEQAKRLS